MTAVGGVAVVAAILVVSACSGGGSSSNSGAEPRMDERLAVPGSAPSQSDSAFASGAAARSGAKQGLLTGVDTSSFDRSQIKTAQIALRSGQVAQVASGVEQVAATYAGFVDSENTETNTHGVATSSSITIRVPVDSFEEAVDSVARLGQLASQKTTTEDVTGRVADVNSRVASEKAAIAQLRLLFNRATKLGDIITLESQLSEREANLEALQAQQRALAAQTALSTIAVVVTRPPAAVAKQQHEDQASGFVGGLRQGWDALVATFQAVAHGLGAVLPLGIVLILLGAAGYYAARRLPKRRPDVGSADTNG